jgi:hypothetical protein
MSVLISWAKNQLDTEERKRGFSKKGFNDTVRIDKEKDIN